MDSGVETGNDSNDSSVSQHENLVGMTTIGIAGQTQFNSINITEVNSLVNTNSITDTSSNVIVLPEATSHESLPGVSESNQNTSNSLVSVNTFKAGLPFLFALVPANDKSFEFRIPSIYNNDCPLSEFLNYGKPKSNYHRKMTSANFNKTKISQRGCHFLEWEYKVPQNVRKMHVAAAANNIEMMERLLNEGVSPNNCDDQGRTPLHLASCRGYTEMVRLLLTHGADPNQRDCLGNTPLHLAAVTNKISVVTLLLKAGTDVLSSDCRGLNPLQLAQTKLRVLQRCYDSDMNQIKDQVRNVIGMLLAYLQKQKDAREQVEALSTLCSRLSLSNTSDQIQDDVRNLLANIDSLSLTN